MIRKTTDSRLSFLLYVLLAGLLTVCARSDEALVKNGSFDDAKEPLKGWLTDYKWTGNSHYIGNKGRVSVVASEAGRTKVAKLKPAGDAGAKMECIPIKFEAGYRYTCELEVKGGPYRIYFAGYKWKPGIRPHEKPKAEELRLIYKGKASSAKGGSSWKKEKIELPGVKLSSTAKKHLKEVRFVTLYIWMMKEGHVDNVKVTRTKDASVKF